MFDATGAFTRQFTAVEGGYVYYPSRRSGGKLVTADEYETLMADWQNVAGRRGRWKMVGLVIGFILLWVLLSGALELPEWTEWIMIGLCVAAMSARLLWVSFAPRRLVSERPDITPARPSSEARREARALLNWPFVVFALIFTGTAFLGSVQSPERTLSWWAWVIGSGVFFGLYVWIGFQKIMDRRR